MIRYAAAPNSVQYLVGLLTFLLGTLGFSLIQGLILGWWKADELLYQCGAWATFFAVPLTFLGALVFGLIWGISKSRAGNRLPSNPWRVRTAAVALLLIGAILLTAPYATAFPIPLLLSASVSSIVISRAMAAA